MRRGVVFFLCALVACSRGDPQVRYAQLEQAFLEAHRAGRSEQALRAATQAVLLAPEREEPYRWASQAFADLGLDEEAVEFYSSVGRRHEGIPWPWFFRGFHHYLLRRYTEALADFERAAALDPDCVECHYRMGLVLDRLGRFEEAARAFRSAWERDPEHASAAAHLVETLRRLGDYEGAERVAAEALAWSPGEPRLLYAAGQLALRRKAYGEAERNLRRALERDPRLAAAHRDLAAVLARTGRKQEAREELLAAKRLEDYEFLKEFLLGQRTSLNMPLLLAEVELTENRPEQALRLLQQAEQRLGPSARLSAARAEALYRLGRLDEADAALAPYAGGTDPRVLLARAAGALARGDRAEARQLLETALGDPPEERQFLRRAADLAGMLGEHDLSRRLLERARQARRIVVERDT